jgi:hypothetical protein
MMKSDRHTTMIEEPKPVKKPNFFQRLFGKKDTVSAKTEQMLGR